MPFLRTLLAAISVTSALSAQVDWLPLRHLVSPGARYGHAMAQDQARGVTVLFGGQLGTVTFGDTWTYDGTSWAQRGVSGPAARVAHSMAYDPLRQVVVLFGGSVIGSGLVDDTWEWNGVSWTRRTPVHRPPARGHAAMAAWPALGGVVLHGGYPIDGTPHFWLWDGIDWTNLTTTDTPNDAGHSMAYHTGLQRLVAVGPTIKHTWDGSQWTRTDEAVPSRHFGRLVYDPVLDRVLAFGGLALHSSDNYLNDTWSWRGVWSRLDPPTSPGGREAFDMVFDPARGRTILYGGLVTSWLSSATLDDMYVLDNVTLPAPYAEPAVAGFGFTSDCPYVGDGLFSLTGKPLLHTGGERAWLGAPFQVSCSGVGGTFNPTPTVLVIGSSNQLWNGVPLPQDLGAIGRPDCGLLVEPSLTIAGTATYHIGWSISIPNLPALVGSTHYFQALGVSLHGPLFTSNGLEIVIGRH